MEDFVNFMREVNLVTVFVRVFLAFLFGGIIGIERGKQGRAAGMRTHVLVALGSTMVSLTGVYLHDVLGFSNDPTRIAAQVISGIGFLGVGTILLKGRFQITGLTTAAGLWATAAICIALGFGFYSGAIISFILATVTVTVMAKVEYKLTKKYNRFGIYVEIESDEFIRSTIDKIKSLYNITDIQVTAPRSAKTGNVGIEANIHTSQNKEKVNPDMIAHEIEKLDNVIFAIESI